MRRVAPAALCVALLAVGCGARPHGGELAALHLDELGGDVWSFTHEVRGRAPAGCVTVELKRGPVLLRVPVRRARFRAVVPLAPGENVVSAYCADPDVDRRDARAVYRVRLPATPRADAALALLPGALVLDAGASAPNASTQLAIESTRWSADASNPAPLATTDGRPLDGLRARRARLGIPEADGEYVVWLDVRDAAGRTDRAGVSFVVQGGRARLADGAEWLDDAVVYGVVPFLFGDPAFDAVTERLPELAHLGVDTLWLSPIFESPDDDYGYGVTDYFRPREEWGSLESFRVLVRAAHARGMRVILDFVPNHSSAEHPYFRHAQRYGRRSPYWGFYARDASGAPTHYFDWEHLPNLDYDDPDVRRWMIEAFSFWTRELDVDGFRVDVAWGVHERAPGFFGRLREELERIEPRVALIAEASARRSAYVEGGFDAAYDWTDEVGQWAWAEAFDEEGEADLGALRDALDATSSAHVLRFLDNNDTGERFASRHGDGLERVASALLFTVPGIPSVFTGQEIGADYHPYEREEPLAFAPDGDRLAHYRRLIALRKSEPALASGAMIPLEAEPADRVLAFARTPVGGGRPVVVVLGFGDAPVDARIHLPDALRRSLRGRDAEPLLGASVPHFAGEWLRVRVGRHEPLAWGFGPAPLASSARAHATP